MPQTQQAGRYGPVEYDEVPMGSPTYALARGQHKVERTFIVKWSDRDAFLKCTLGFPYLVTTNESAPYNGFVQRFMPLSTQDLTDPDATADTPWLLASAVTRMEGKGARGFIDASTFIPVYEKAQITLLFESSTYKHYTDAQMPTLNAPNGTRVIVEGFVPTPAQAFSLRRYITKIRKPSAEFIQLPRGFMNWAYDNPTFAQLLTLPPRADFATAQLQASLEIQWTWHEVPFVPEASRLYIGYVNQFPVTDGKDTYNAETLLLLSADIKPYRTAAGAFVNDITYRCKYFEPEPGKGHNHFLRYEASFNRLTRQRITTTGYSSTVTAPRVIPGTTTLVNTLLVPKNVYPSADFANLFYKNCPPLPAL